MSYEARIRVGGTHLGLHILRVVFAIDVTRGRIVHHAERRVADLSGEPVLEIEQTCLADVLDLRARLADDSSLEAHARAGIPAEDSEGARARPARAAVLLLGLLKQMR